MRLLGLSSNRSWNYKLGESKSQQLQKTLYEKTLYATGSEQTVRAYQDQWNRMHIRWRDAECLEERADKYNSKLHENNGGKGESWQETTKRTSMS
jgi:hypothetical protein